MKNIFILVNLFLFFEGQCQIDMVRYNDNFSMLKNDTLKKGMAMLKYRKMGDHFYFSFGGELREHFQYVRNQNFGDGLPGAKRTDVAQLWHRIKIHSNLEAGKKNKDLFTTQ